MQKTEGTAFRFCFVNLYINREADSFPCTDCAKYGFDIMSFRADEIGEELHAHLTIILSF